MHSLGCVCLFFGLGIPGSLLALLSFETARHSMASLCKLYRACWSSCLTPGQDERQPPFFLRHDFLSLSKQPDNGTDGWVFPWIRLFPARFSRLFSFAWLGRRWWVRLMCGVD